jgi:phosphate transport system protein
LHESGEAESSAAMIPGLSIPAPGQGALSRVGGLVDPLIIHETPCASRPGAVMPQEKSDRAVPGLANRHALAAQDELWSEILEFASAVESMLNQAVQVLCEHRTELADSVKAQERAINEWEVRIEESCIRALALYEPVATDLRRMVSILRLRAVLERIGDLATKIARRSRRFFEASLAPPIPVSLVILAVAVTDAFGVVIKALSTDDASAALSVISGEEAIDRQHELVLRELKNSLRHHPEQVKPLLRLMNSARNLERIGDHIVNIAEAIVFIKEGLGHTLPS